MIYLHDFPDGISDILCIICICKLHISMPAVKFNFFAYKTCNNTLLHGFMDECGIKKKNAFIKARSLKLLPDIRQHCSVQSH